MERVLKIIAVLGRHLGVSLSAFMHLFLFMLLLINFPQCSRNPSPPVIIAVDLLPITKNTNIENKQKTKKIEEKLEEKKEATKSEPVLEKEDKKSKEQPKPEPVKPEVKPENKPDLKKEVVHDKLKKEEKKKDNKEKQTPNKKNHEKVDKKDDKKKKNPKPKVSEIDKILKNLQAEESKDKTDYEVAEKTSKGPFNTDRPLSLNIKDAIRHQIEQCWNPPAGNRDAAKLQVLLRISFKEDGAVANVKVLDSGRYNSDELYKVAADAAVRAVYKASPLQGLPANQYNSWKELELNFNPSDILGD